MNKKSNKSSSSSSIKLLEHFSKHVVDLVLFFPFISLAPVSQNYSEDIALLLYYLSIYSGLNPLSKWSKYDVKFFFARSKQKMI